MPTIMGLVKMCKSLEHVEDFQNGILHSNRVRYFRDKGIDPFEGASLIGVGENSTITLTTNGQSLEAQLLLGESVQMYSDWISNLNVFCMFAMHSGKFDQLTENNIDEFKKLLEIGDVCRGDFGEYAVVIKNPTEFFKRVDKIAKNYSYITKRKLVTYYDEDDPPSCLSGPFLSNLHDTGRFDPSIFDPAFLKRNVFKHQKEYRIAICTGTTGCNYIQPSIGDITDISFSCKTDEIDDQIQLSIRDNVR